jgi:CRP-like cAMP-binding protein
MPPLRIAFDKELVLARHFLLRHLEPEDLKRLAASARLANFTRNATIFQKGDPGNSMMAVVRGRVKICSHSIDGKELVLNFVDTGGLFGEIALLDGEPRTADAVALVDSDLLVLDRTQFVPFLEARAGIALRLIAVLCKRLRQTSEHLEDMLFLEASSRFARSLLRLAEVFGRREAEGLRIDIRLSQQQLGSLVGVSRESINKFLGDWQRTGVIALEGGCIVVRDRHALEDIAGSSE